MPPQMDYYCEESRVPSSCGLMSQEAGLEREPAPGLEREPAPGLEREPAPGLEREPAPGLEREPAPGLEREPAPGLEREPAPGLEREPAPGLEREPAPGLERESAAISCMLVGDGAVGKTSMIVSYTSNGYPTEYKQTGFDVFSGQVQVEGAPVRIQLLDTAGQEVFDDFRSLSYSQTDVFLLCFSVVNPTSFHNVTNKWIPEIRACNPSAPIILVGTQSDLLLDVNVLINLARRGVKPVLTPRARSMAVKIRAADYVECSSLTQKNLKEAFDAAIFAAIKHKVRKEKKRQLSDRRSKAFSKCSWKKLFCFI